MAASRPSPSRTTTISDSGAVARAAKEAAMTAVSTRPATDVVQAYLDAWNAHDGAPSSPR